MRYVVGSCRYKPQDLSKLFANTSVVNGHLHERSDKWSELLSTWTFNDIEGDYYFRT